MFTTRAGERDEVVRMKQFYANGMHCLTTFQDCQCLQLSLHELKLHMHHTTL